MAHFSHQRRLFTIDSLWDSLRDFFKRRTETKQTCYEIGHYLAEASSGCHRSFLALLSYGAEISVSWHPAAETGGKPVPMRAGGGGGVAGSRLY